MLYVECIFLDLDIFKTTNLAPFFTPFILHNMSDSRVYCYMKMIHISEIPSPFLHCVFGKVIKIYPRGIFVNYKESTNKSYHILMSSLYLKSSIMYVYLSISDLIRNPGYNTRDFKMFE